MRLKTEKQQRKINEIKRSFTENLNEIEKSLARQIRKKERKDKFTNSKSKIRND